MLVLRLLWPLAGTLGLVASASSLPPYPATPKVPLVVRDFAGRYTDNYAWLEADGSSRVVAWAAQQRAYALGYLQRQAAFAPLSARVAELARTSTSRFRLQIDGGRWFYERFTPPQPQPELVARDGLSGAERVLYDPVAAARGGVPQAVESVFPNPEGSKVAFTTQLGGTEEETMRVVDARSGALFADTIPHAGGGVSGAALVWDADGKGFLYARYPQDVPPAERHFNIALYHHALGGDPSADRYVFGHGQSRVAEYILLRSRDGSRTAALIEPGDLGDYAVWVRDGTGPFRQVASVADHVKSGAFVDDTLLLRTSRIHPTFDVVALERGQNIGQGRTFIAAGKQPIEDVVVAAGHVFTPVLDGGDSAVDVYAKDGTSPVRTFPSGSVRGEQIHEALTELAGDPDGDVAILGYTTYGVPSRWMRYDATSGHITTTGVEMQPPADYSHLEVEREFVRSLDGTARIPLTIVHLPGIVGDGSAPTVLTAYGGYGISTRPGFIGTWLAWLERGGVYAFASVRGGGEYGAAWHLAALHSTKTKSADDLGSCARWLETHGFGDAQHLGIIGGSDGGFLMGLAITRNPSIYRAVVGQVGIYDIPGWQRSPNGASNIPEFGDARIPTDFAYIIKQSPYQNVRDGVKYPAMLMTTGENDPRVSPMNSRKMTARLQAASTSGYPVLLVQNAGQGHGIGSSFQQRLDLQVNVLTFFASQLSTSAIQRE